LDRDDVPHVSVGQMRLAAEFDSDRMIRMIRITFE
jgi:hypothetical protein